MNRTNCRFLLQMSHMPNLSLFFVPVRPSLLRRRIHSLSIPHQPQPSTVSYCCGYPTLFNTIPSQINHSSIHTIFSLQRKTKCVRALFQGLHPASQISLNPRALDQLPIPTCKVIKLFNSNNLIQTFSFLFFPLYLIFFYSIFPFHILDYTIYLKR